MSLWAVWLALLTGLGLASAGSAALLGSICRRQFKTLESAGRRIDALTSRLERLEGESEVRGGDARAEPPGRNLGRSKPATSAARAIPSLPLSRSEPPLATAVADPTLIAVPNLAASSSAEPEPASAELGQRFGAIWELADSGAPAEAIARATGQPIGQVELILGLRRQFAAGPGLARIRGSRPL